MDGLQNKITSIGDVAFQPVIPLSSDVYNQLDNADVLLLGPLTVDPAKQVQRANQQNKLVSIVVLIFPHQFQKIKQQIQFGYNVGKNVTIVQYDFGKDITSVVDAALKRAQQRKSFLKISDQLSFPAPASREITFQNLSVFLENAPIGAIVFDLAKKVVSANQKARLYFDHIDFRYQVNWESLFPGEDYPQISNAANETVHEVLKVNNQYLEINISPLRVEKDAPHFLLLINDITRTINVENQLMSKIEELEFLNTELDEFVNVVSHDFKTPLTSIGLLAQLTLREKSHKKQMEFVAQILNSSNKLKEQLNGLTKLVDIKKKRNEKFEDIDLRERLTIIVSEYGDLADQNAELITNFTEPTIRYFRAHIDSIFSNLVTNAFKYRKEGQKLRVEVSSRSEQDYVILTVKDNGIGMDLTKNMNKLFQPFKRLTDQSTGSGLGLSLVKRMIEHDNGYLEVFSTPGEGTEFKIYLKKQ